MIAILITFTVFSLLFVSSSILYAQALPKNPNWGWGKSVCNTTDNNGMTCCWEEAADLSDGLGPRTITYCQTCWGPYDDYGGVYNPNDTRAPTGNEASPGLPPTEGISDDPQAGDNPNPSIPPTGGVSDETESQNSESDNDNTDSTNTVPRKGGSGLDPSKLNENAIQ